MRINKSVKVCVAAMAVMAVAAVGCGGDDATPEESGPSSEQTLEALRLAGELQDLAIELGDTERVEEFGRRLSRTSSSLERATADAQTPSLEPALRALEMQVRTLRQLISVRSQAGEALTSNGRPEIRSARGKVRAAQGLVTTFDQSSRRALSGIEGALDDLDAAGAPTDYETGDGARADLRDLERERSSTSSSLQRVFARLLDLLNKEASELRLVQGPADCGATDSGAMVLIIEGEIACSDAIQVISNSSGPNSSTAPPGWDCSLLPLGLDGTEYIAASGFACVSETGVKLSVLAPDPVPVPSPPSSADCPPGTVPAPDFVDEPCVVAETGGEEAGP